jgi:hypothetical protein
MPALENACPMSREVRAQACGACCARAESLPPCVTAWLNEKLEVVPARAVRAPAMLEKRRAA